jgi:hypothetical protein
MREYARMRGVSVVAVSKAVKTKRISLVRGKIDPAKADKEWAANTQPGQRAAKARRKAPSSKVDAMPPAVGELPGIPEPEPNTYAAARAKREELHLKSEQMDFDLKMGELVRASDIRERLAKLHTEAKTRLLGVASKCKARIPQLSAIDVSIIEDLIREALGEIANASG